MRPAVPLFLPALIAAALLAGCGGGSDGTGTTGHMMGGGASASGAPAGAAAQRCSMRAAMHMMGGMRGVGAIHVTGLSCAEGRAVIARWGRVRGCLPRAGASRAGCSAGGYRCLSVSTDRGVKVSCARAGRSLGFTVRR